MRYIQNVTAVVMGFRSMDSDVFVRILIFQILSLESLKSETRVQLPSTQ